MRLKFQQNKNDLSRFLRSTDFSKAIVLTLSIIIPITVFSKVGALEIGVSIAMGCLLSSPSDVTGTLKHRTLGIFFAALLGAFSYIIARYASVSAAMVIPMLLIMIFGIAFLSVFGFRASLVSFSGLLAVVLSFAAVNSGLVIWEKGLFIFMGGIWYLIVSTTWYLIRPQRATEQLLAETMEITAEYLRIRVRLLGSVKLNENHQDELLQLQTELNEHHESLREVLLSSRKTSGTSGYARKRLLVFIDLVDMLELAMANPIDYNKMKVNFKDDMDILNHFAVFTLHLARHLDKIAFSLHRNKTIPDNDIQKEIDELGDIFENYRNKIDMTQKRDAILMLRHLYDYQVKQAHKILNIDRLLKNLEVKRKLAYKDKEIKKFITPNEYSFKKLSNNFNLDSVIFRHALRMSLIVVIGYVIGEYFSVQNSYWILLTVIVIMRPNYGLTKQRTRKRIVGTLIGGAIAVGIVFLTQNTTLYAIFGILSLTMAFSLIQKNYTTAAVFITLSIVFIYALMQPEVLKVIQFRIFDTLIGATLAAAGNFILWPKWEKQTIDNVISASVEANKVYLEEIIQYYHTKGKLRPGYKLSRKKAFLEIGNLNGAFQRMAQEPKSKQENLSLIYEIVGLNQTFLSALASLGTYIRTHPTTEASSEFDTYSRGILNNLEKVNNYLENKEMDNSVLENTEEASETLQKRFDKLVKERDLEIRSGKSEIGNAMRFKLQEAHLIIGQLEWLLDISNKLSKNIEKLKNLQNE